MIELALIGASFVLTGHSVREHRRLKTIAYAAAETSDTPEAARSAFFKMVDSSNGPSQDVNRVDSPPQTHGSSVPPTHQQTNFTQNPMTLVPDISPQPEKSSISTPHEPYTRPERRRSCFIPEHVQEAIDKKWEAKMAKADAKYHKRCAKLDGKRGKGSQHIPPNPATEAKYQERQQKLDAKHNRRKKTLELRRCTETSLTESKHRHKAEKQQGKGLTTENALPQVHVSTDRTGEQSNERQKRKSGRSSRRWSSQSSFMPVVFMPKTAGSKTPTPAPAPTPASACKMPMMNSIGGGAAAAACMTPMFGGAAGGPGGC